MLHPACSAVQHDGLSSCTQERARYEDGSRLSLKCKLTTGVASLEKAVHLRETQLGISQQLAMHTRSFAKVNH